MNVIENEQEMSVLSNFTKILNIPGNKTKTIRIFYNNINRLTKI